MAMADREKAIRILEQKYSSGVFRSKDELIPVTDIIVLLKAQDALTVEPKLIDLQQETKAWLDEMDAVDALGNIADICMDFDGYRTADGLGGLINEVRTYARYCADKLLKTQKPICKCDMWFCGRCKTALAKTWMFCPKCGQAVKWE